MNKFTQFIVTIAAIAILVHLFPIIATVSTTLFYVICALAALALAIILPIGFGVMIYDHLTKKVIKEAPLPSKRMSKLSIVFGSMLGAALILGFVMDALARFN